MKESTTRILIVDDYEDWRRKVRQLLQASPELLVIGEASDGLEAVQAEEGTATGRDLPHSISFPK